MRWFLIVALTAALVLDIWFARHVADQEIGSATKYHAIEKYQEHPIEGPFIVGARDSLVAFIKFAEDNEGAVTALSTLFIALFTVVLAWATIGLWKAADQQKSDMRESLRIAGESAKAALIQANTMMSAERGYAKMFHCQQLNLSNVSESIRFQMEIKNWGRTPLQVTDIAISTYVLDVGEPLPKEPPYDTCARLAAHAFLVAMEPFYFWINALASCDSKKVQEGTQILYLIGYVDYTDKFGIERRGGYARRYGPLGELIFVTQENYNYDRTR